MRAGIGKMARTGCPGMACGARRGPLWHALYNCPSPTLHAQFLTFAFVQRTTNKQPLSLQRHQFKETVYKLEKPAHLREVPLGSVPRAISPSPPSPMRNSTPSPSLQRSSMHMHYVLRRPCCCCCPDVPRSVGALTAVDHACNPPEPHVRGLALHFLLHQRHQAVSAAGQTSSTRA